MNNNFEQQLYSSIKDSDITLRDFQIEGIKQICNNEEKYNHGSILAYQMGLGKTITAATFLIFKQMIEKPELPDLVVVPLCVIHQWKEEILRLDPSKNVHIYHGPKRVLDFKLKKNNDINDAKIDFVIATYHIFVSQELQEYKWNRIMVDEAHILRNGTVNVYRNVPKKVKGAYALSEQCKFSHCITGTPFNNRIEDIMSLMTFVKSHTDVFNFVDKFIIQKSKEGIIKPINTEIIMIDKPISPEIMNDYNEMYKTYNFKKSQMNSTNDINKKRKLYNGTMKLLVKLRLFCDIMMLKSNYDDCEIIVEDVIGENEGEIEEKNRLEMGLEKTGKKSPIVSKHDKLNFYKSSIKINLITDKIINNIDKVPNFKMVVFSAFVSTLDIIECIINDKRHDIATFKYIGSTKAKDRVKIIDQFKELNGKPSVLFISFGAGSVGLNLDCCSTLIISDMCMNPFDELQAVNRVHRLTQQNQVQIYKYCMKDMVEEQILKSHEGKFEVAKDTGLLLV